MPWIASIAVLAGLGMMHGAKVDTTPGCVEARRTNGWCKATNAGYVASLEIHSRFLYEVLDAHGHQIVPEAVTCETCRSALKSNGFCATHRMGYVGGKAFMTPLTYELALGRTIDPAAITCDTCRKHTHGIGWCEEDQVGIVGYTAIDDRRHFEDLVKAYRILEAAIETSARCERCAGAMVADGYCAIHRLKYKDGQVVHLAAGDGGR
jgi:hypothetical protein